MSYILSLETATPILSLALHQEGQTITSIAHHLPHSASKVLVGRIDDMLELHDISLQSLDALAISAGPGSYTGLRVGWSVAKGLCMGSGLPLIGVDTLTSMVVAGQDYPIQGAYGALLDARNGYAYGLLADANGHVLASSRKYKVEVASFAKWLEKHPVYFIGSGAMRYKQALQGHPNSRFISNLHPEARYMGKMAYVKWLKKDFVNQASFEPCYEGV